MDIAFGLRAVEENTGKIKRKISEPRTDHGNMQRGLRP